MTGFESDPPNLPEEIEFRACCGKLRWALLDILDGLTGQGARLRALRWGTGEVPVDLSVDDRSPDDSVEELLAATARFFGTNASCFTGGGTLVVERHAGVRT